MMQIFDIPNGALVDEKRMVSAEWQKSLSDLYQQAQRELGTEGFLIPMQPTDTVTARSVAKFNGNLTLDTDRQQLIVTINGLQFSLNMTPI